ncbi:MAG: alpha/beta hydrolase [Variovorax sp.]|jgi:acetyl esterase|nr:MAG: alpha/beta hydrolase [Variovorax sp.]
MLHPQARALLDLIEERGLPATHTLTPAEARSVYRDRRRFTQPDAPEVDEVRERQADGPHGAIALRFYRPLGSGAAVLPVLVYFHGGGWTIGDLDTHDTLCRELANGSGCAVVAVDYRMGPEHRFPAAIDDALAATRWVRREAATLGVDADRLAVGGDSAGGNLAAVVALAARDAGDPPIAFQLLIYPATDMRRGHPSHVRNGRGYLLTRESIAYYHDHYIDDPRHDLDWRASPLLASDFAGLPPALVITAGHDPLVDEGADYARRLSEAGNRVSYVCFERQIHGFITMGRVLDEAHTAVALCAVELRRALTAPSG